MSTSFIPAIITATVAFIAAVVAQWLSHFFSRKRESVKDYKEINQELIFPSLNDIILFIETEIHYRKGHDVEITINTEQLIESIQSKISYGNSDLINSIYRYRNSISYFDGRGEAENMSIFEVFFSFLDYAYEVMKKSNYSDSYLLNIIRKNQKLYGMSFILTDLVGKEQAIYILSHKWLWSSNFLEKVSIGNIKKIIENYNDSTIDYHELICFISLIKIGFEESPDIETFDNLMNSIEDIIKELKNRWRNSEG